MKKVTNSSQNSSHPSVSSKVPVGTLCVLALLLITSTGMFGQAATASSTLAGTVTDKTGAVVVGVTVTATDTATNNTRRATTNSLGAYRFEVLPPGIYSVKANMAGFSSPTAPKV